MEIYRADLYEYWPYVINIVITASNVQQCFMTSKYWGETTSEGVSKDTGVRFPSPASRALFCGVMHYEFPGVQVEIQKCFSGPFARLRKCSRPAIPSKNFDVSCP